MRLDLPSRVVEGSMRMDLPPGERWQPRTKSMVPLTPVKWL